MDACVGFVAHWNDSGGKRIGNYSQNFFGGALASGTFFPLKSCAPERKRSIHVTTSQNFSPIHSHTSRRDHFCRIPWRGGQRECAPRLLPLSRDSRRHDYFYRG